jgi:K+-sensing histidine kinase KdpD
VVRRVRALSVAFNEMAASLERAEQIRRQLLADVAHELRNPSTESAAAGLLRSRVVAPCNEVSDLVERF